MNPHTITINPDGSITLPAYTPDPTFLRAARLGLTLHEKEVYRAVHTRLVTLSIPHMDRYSDEHGNIFVIFTNDELAKHCGISLSSVKKAKQALVHKKLMRIQPIPGSRAVRIYPLYPEDAPTYPFYRKTKKGGGSSASSTPAVTSYSQSSYSTFDSDEFFGAAVRKSLGGA